jgi:methylated-DNA-[protein]-cysteine S-methyltransferase
MVFDVDEPLVHDELATPVGVLHLLADSAGRLHALGWFDGHARMASVLDAYRARRGGVLERVENPGGLTAALRSYFAGDLGAIVDLPLVLHGTEFQRAVYRALLTIPCGKTLSYGSLARRIGRPSAVRAVGLANGANPVGIVVPCHRVIGSDGTLTGYGGGLERKRWLLSHEGALPDAERALPLPFAVSSPST